LIISIDPAHSLSDSLEIKLETEAKKVAKNLYAAEIDPAKAVEEYKEKLAPQIEKIDFLKGSGLEDTFDIAGMAPGIDEIAAFDRFLRYMHSNEYDIIIFDTAPTGHALRFLSLPEVLDSWLGKMIKLRLRFSGMINTLKKVLPFGKGESDTKFGTEQLEEMKHRIEKAREIMSDPNKTHYNLVLIPEMMSILESERSLKVLNEYRIPTETIIVNMLIPENPHCKFCTERRKQQLERVEMIKKKFKDYKILQLHLFRNEVKGIKMLAGVSKILFEA